MTAESSRRDSVSIPSFEDVQFKGDIAKMFGANNAIQILSVDKHSKRPLKAQLLPLDID